MLLSSQIKLPPVGGGGSGSAVWRANEPAGSTLLTERQFSAQPEDGWGLGAASGTTANFSIVSDAAAIKTPPNVGRVLFPLGFLGGGEPCILFKGLNTTIGNKLYVCMAIKMSNPWEGHPTTTNKIIHCVVNGSNRVIMNARGGSTDPLLVTIALQSLAGSYDAASGGGVGVGASVFLTPNMPGQTGAQLIRGQWHQWEMVFNAGTPGSADGAVDWWLDGVKVGSWNSIPLIALGGNATWEEIHWEPTWGGGGSSIPADQYQYIDHFYVSGHA